MNHIIEIENLTKSYGKLPAVRGISFYVETGRLFAFLGPNGAGKSTTIDIICTFLKPDSGTVLVNGFPLGKGDRDIRKSIGVVFQDSLLDKLLTVEENLYYRGSLYGLKGKALSAAVREAMFAVGVADYAKRPCGKLSGGQRRRCDIARALLHTPSVLFLDEPTTGLDPQTRKAVWETIQTLQRKSGMTVFLTTHYMEEAARADYVLVLDHGGITARGTPAQLREQYTHDTLKLLCPNPAAAERIAALLKGNCVQASNQISVSLPGTMDALPILRQFEPFISGFEVTAGTMDDAFINITGKELRQ